MKDERTTQQKETDRAKCIARKRFGRRSGIEDDIAQELALAAFRLFQTWELPSDRDQARVVATLALAQLLTVHHHEPATLEEILQCDFGTMAEDYWPFIAEVERILKTLPAQYRSETLAALWDNVPIKDGVLKQEVAQLILSELDLMTYCEYPFRWLIAIDRHLPRTL